MTRRLTIGPTLIGERLTEDDMQELLRDPKPNCQREASDVQLRRCPLNPRAWAPAGSLAAGICLCCNTPLAKAA